MKLPTVAGILAAAVLAAGMLAACAGPDELPATQTPGAPPQGQLTPYHSATPPQAETAPPMLTATPPPPATPTPRIHTVKKGEDMGGIAWQYGISVAELMSANPEVSPNLMSVGAELVIPPSRTAQPDAPAQEGDALPSPTPVAVEVGPLHCAPGADGGVYCFLPVLNPLSITLESLSAVVNLSGSQGEAPISRSAYAMLDRLPPGGQTALSVYFSAQEAAGLSQPYTYSSQMLTALPGAERDGRYLPVRLDQQVVQISANGLSAAVTAEAVLEGGSRARRLWVAATAYDAQGKVVGVRRWEMPDGAELESDKPLPVSFWVYTIGGGTTGGEIARVELQAEARP